MGWVLAISFGPAALTVLYFAWRVIDAAYRGRSHVDLTCDPDGGPESGAWRYTSQSYIPSKSGDGYRQYKMRRADYLLGAKIDCWVLLLQARKKERREQIAANLSKETGTIVVYGQRKLARQERANKRNLERQHRQAEQQLRAVAVELQDEER